MPILRYNQHKLLISHQKPSPQHNQTYASKFLSPIFVQSDLIPRSSSSSDFWSDMTQLYIGRDHIYLQYVKQNFEELIKNTNQSMKNTKNLDKIVNLQDQAQLFQLNQGVAKQQQQHFPAGIQIFRHLIDLQPNFQFSQILKDLICYYIIKNNLDSQRYQETSFSGQDREIFIKIKFITKIKLGLFLLKNYDNKFQKCFDLSKKLITESVFNKKQKKLVDDIMKTLEQLQFVETHHKNYSFYKIQWKQK